MNTEQLKIAGIQQKLLKYRKVFGLKLWYKFDRCAWQINLQNHKRGEPLKRWGWKPWKDKGHGRFGGGWSWKLGLIGSSSTMIIEFFFGSVRITRKEPANVR